MDFRVFFASIAIVGVSIFEPLLVANQLDEMQFYSQAGQDKFVYSILYGLLDKHDKGYYLEIGAGEPMQINNTYAFEKNLQWEGVSIDISENLAERWYDARENLLLSEDATKSDYPVILQNFPLVIDYLSLDVDGYYDVVLEKLSEANHIFKVITIEHDFYRYGDLYRTQERKILTKLGYYLLCSNVSNNGFAFEDWWIHPDFFPSNIFSALTSLDFESKDYAEIIEAIRIVVQDNN